MIEQPFESFMYLLTAFVIFLLLYKLAEKHLDKAIARYEKEKRDERRKNSYETQEIITKQFQRDTQSMFRIGG